MGKIKLSSSLWVQVGREERDDRTTARMRTRDVRLLRLEVHLGSELTCTGR